MTTWLDAAASPQTIASAIGAAVGAAVVALGKMRGTLREEIRPLAERVTRIERFLRIPPLTAVE